MQRTGNIRDEPAIQNLLKRLPNNVANSFSDEQLIHLFTAIGSRSWGKHSLDMRGVFTIPFYARHFYYVVLVGKNYRVLSRREKAISNLALAFITSILLIFFVFVGLLALYLIKSALGINLFENFSLGIWDWFKSFFN